MWPPRVLLAVLCWSWRWCSQAAIPRHRLRKYCRRQEYQIISYNVGCYSSIACGITVTHNDQRRMRRRVFDQTYTKLSIGTSSNVVRNSPNSIFAHTILVEHNPSQYLKRRAEHCISVSSSQPCFGATEPSNDGLGSGEIARVVF